ncbi:MAG: hypothetical protein HFI10_03865 [Lachnospiraceae bacterium]|jgi:hypothetical protein|nr:hypothetical protein [Lachnospiraceae bacterium]
MVDKKIEIVRMTKEKEHFFFGYYDISPESPDGSKILVNKTSFIEHMPEKDDELEVGYIVSDTLEYIPFGKSTAWNFQEGCRLQWLDGSRCIYNTRGEKGFHAVIYDIESKQIVKTYDVPIYSVSIPAGKALFYSFTNNKYCYAHTEQELDDDPYKDGIYILDLYTSEYQRIVSIENLENQAQIKGINSWTEYCVFNEEGTLFYFYYRWIDKNGGAHTMFCVSDLSGKVELLLNSNFISHAGWKGNHSITVWGRIPNKINALQSNSFLKKTGLWKKGIRIFHKFVRSDKKRQMLTNDSYILFDLQKHEMNKIVQKEFTSDGHETWSKNGRFMLTDTYPDADDNRLLMLFDYLTNEIFLLGKFYSYPDKMKETDRRWNECGLRCDLHPKWGKSEKYVYFDSVHEGYRGLYRANVSELIKERGKNE